MGLSTLKVGDIVVRDNLSSHQVAGVKEAIESVGAQGLYLPPYSPGFNPIWKCFLEVEDDGAKIIAETQGTNNYPN